MSVSVSKLFLVLAIIAFVAAFLGDTVFGHGGVELLGAGLALYASAELAEEVLTD